MKKYIGLSILLPTILYTHLHCCNNASPSLPTVQVPSPTSMEKAAQFQQKTEAMLTQPPHTKSSEKKKELHRTQSLKQFVYVRPDKQPIN